MSVSEGRIFGCLDPTHVDPQPDGYRVLFSGWAFSTTPRTDLLEVSIQQIGTVIGTATCGQFRQDLLETFPDLPNPGVGAFSCPVRFPPGQQRTVKFDLCWQAADGSFQTLASAEVLFPSTTFLAKIQSELSQRQQRLSRGIGLPGLIFTQARNWLRRHGRLPRLREFPRLFRSMITRCRNACGYNSAVDTHAELNVRRYKVWLENSRWTPLKAATTVELCRSLKSQPLLSIVLPAVPENLPGLLRAVDSVRWQIYAHWDLCIAGDPSTLKHLADHLALTPDDHRRVRCLPLVAGTAGSEAWNRAAAAATGEFLVNLTSADVLTPDCLAELAAAINSASDVDVVYSDHDRLNESGERSAPQFKPDWSPELLLSHLYFGNSFCVRRSLFESLDGIREGIEGWEDFDLALRTTEQARQIVHVPRILFHTADTPKTPPESGHKSSTTLGQSVVQQALERRGVVGQACPSEAGLIDGRLAFQIAFPEDGPKVSLLIPTKNGLELVQRCIESIRKRTTYRNYEIVVIDNDSDDPATLEYLSQLPAPCQVLRISNPDGKFSYAHINNEAVRQVDGELVLFLNNDTEVLRGEWLSQLVGYQQFAGVGAVGARLLYPDNRIQHAGVIVGLNGHFRNTAGHIFRSLPASLPGYLSYPRLPRNFSAVTAACMLMRRQLFLEMGGFDERRFAVAYNDVDLCLRLGDAGLRSTYAPLAELRHYEGTTRGFVDHINEVISHHTYRGQYTDPYYNPNLAQDSEISLLSSRCTTARLPASRLPIRVLLCIDSLNAADDAARNAFNVAVRLRQRGKVIPVVVAEADGPMADEYRAAGIPVHLLTELSEGTDETAENLTEALSGWISRNRIDVVFAHAASTYWGVLAAHRTQRGSLWYIPTCLQQAASSRVLGKAAKAGAFEAAYRVVFDCHATRSFFEPEESRCNFSVVYPGLPAGEIRQFMNSCSREAARQAVGCPTDTVLVSLVGAVDQSTVLDFAAAVRHILDSGRRDVQFCVAGQGTGHAAAALASLLKSYSNQVRYHPEPEEPWRYYRASDISICGSMNQAISAMAFGLPIVALDHPGISERFADNTTAYFAPVRKPQVLAGRILDLLDHEDRRKQLGAAALAMFTIIGDFEAMVTDYEALLLEAFTTTGGEIAGTLESTTRPQVAA